MTVTKLGETAGTMLANVNRWRGQLGLKPIGASALPKLTKELKIDDTTATVVTLTGDVSASKAPAMKGAPFAMPGAKKSVGSQATPKFTKPGDWIEMPNASQKMAVAYFRTSKNEPAAEVTISMLGGTAGGVAANVSRWRGQVKLAPVDDAELAKSMKEIQVAGRDAVYADLMGPEGAGRLRILGVILPGNGQTWFIKMSGPAEQVTAQKNTFDAFLGTITLGEGQGAKP